MQTKLTKQEIGKLKQTRNGIVHGVIWARTDEGFDYWNEVIRLLDAKIKHGTSDGKPWVDPEPQIPDGWRKAEADEWTRKDVKYWDLYEKDWRPRLSQGTAFDPPVMQTHYIVPIDPPLTDQDARDRPWVMVTDETLGLWVGPRTLLAAPPKTVRYVVGDSPGVSFWKQARRATPAEIEAAE